MRRFVRHPSSIPIELSIGSGEAASAPQIHSAVEREEERTSLHNISTGGLACGVPRPLPVGSPVVLRIPMIWPDYQGHGVVAWCRPSGSEFEVGIQFGARDVFKARMVEQLSQIESYRQQIFAEQGRQLDGEQAACEWIREYACDFAKAFPSSDDGG